MIGGRSLALVATLVPLTLVATVIAQDEYADRVESYPCTMG